LKIGGVTGLGFWHGIGCITHNFTHSNRFCAPHLIVRI